MAWLFILALVVGIALSAGVTYIIAKNSFEKKAAANDLRNEKMHQFELDEKTAQAAKDAVAGLKARDLAKILNDLDESDKDFYTYVAYLILEYQDLLDAKEEGKNKDEINKELLDVFDALYYVISNADNVVEDEATIKVTKIKVAEE